MGRNKQTVFSMLGARNYAKEDREINDYYATEPKAVELLLEVEKFNPVIWECACGEGYISEVLKKHNYDVISTDLFYRGYGSKETLDFLNVKFKDLDVDIITNPPYKYALEFLERAVDNVKTGRKIAMFLKLQFLEGKRRKQFFLNTPPKVIYVSSSRLCCARNGKFSEQTGKAVCFAWFVWEKGFKGNPIIKWIN